MNLCFGDNKGRLSHLFWCDGTTQRDYVIFGDVLAFDVTYKRNKYMCPLVVLFYVNNHNEKRCTQWCNCLQ